jgi:hypothetical protein
MSSIENLDPLPYDGTGIALRYMWWVTKELNHSNPNIDAYAKLIISEFARLEKGEITIEEFNKNTSNIEDETPLNYIQNQIILHYPN